MKTILIPTALAALLLAGTATTAAAQDCSGPGNAACITQIGNHNTTTIDQSGATNGNVVVTLGDADAESNGARLDMIQRGNNNRAELAVRGRENGTGTIASRTVGLGMQAEGLLGIFRATSDPAQPLITESLTSGLIAQDGNGNLAAVAIVGNENQFHVSQNGDANIAGQAVFGSNNSAAIVQGTTVGAGGAKGDNNIALQLQVGNGNVAYALQKDHGNRAVQVQVGTGALTPSDLGGIELLGAGELSSFSELMAPSSTNESLLEQDGNGTAVLVQAGNDNTIALRQPNGGSAVIGQFGSGRSVQIEQRGGSGGVTPIFIIQSGGGR